METIRLEAWKLGLASDKAVRGGFCPRTAKEAEAGCETVISAKVPGNFELDLLEEGMIDDPYYAENIHQLRGFETTHLWYFTTFDLARREDTVAELFFGGIDTIADIYIDGDLIGSTANMLISHTFSLADLDEGTHELLVHITPPAVYVRAQEASLSATGQTYTHEAVYIRKAAYMYGWDIMPRAISGGLWKDVEIRYQPITRFDEYYLTTMELHEDHALLRFGYKIRTDAERTQDLSYTVEGRCKDSTFSVTNTLYTAVGKDFINVPHPYLWMPRNYGEPNLYEVTVSLYENGVLKDRRELEFGIRIAELVRTSLAGDDGDFCFMVNGKRVFVLGSNWVPPDAFPSRHAAYQMRGLQMLADLGCNMVRCWGGNVYPDEAFYSFCDRNGIMIWQDFCMACARYPDFEWINRAIEREATQIVKEKRNHAALVLWAGDNECDESAIWGGFAFNIYGRKVYKVNPDENTITRTVLKRVIRNHDFARDYLPSSPYFDGKVFPDGAASEMHLWGPRDFFKGDFYRTSPAHFASETGYHGCPDVATLRAFIPEEHLLQYGDESHCTDRVWLTHATAVEPIDGLPNTYRIPLMSRQIKRLFGDVPSNIEEYALKSQISQAEAMKYFIERFRVGKWRRTGIIWWNVIDGWPQISDAVVDWYGRKKLAYDYIKRSQAPFCIMISEPDADGLVNVVAVNDTRSTQKVRFEITEMYSGKTVFSGECECPSDINTTALRFHPQDEAIYAVRWFGDREGQNHYVANIGDGLELDRYTQAMKKYGFL